MVLLVFAAGAGVSIYFARAEAVRTREAENLRGKGVEAREDAVKQAESARRRADQAKDSEGKAQNAEKLATLKAGEAAEEKRRLWKWRAGNVKPGRKSSI